MDENKECDCAIRSACCDAEIPMWPDMDICLKCKEHTEPAECECESENHPSDLIAKGKMFDEVLETLKQTHNLYVAAVRKNHQAHDITRISYNDLIIKEAEKL